MTSFPIAQDAPGAAEPMNRARADRRAQAGAVGPMVVLYLDHTAALSGGEIALLRLLEALDRTVVRPVVVLADAGPLVARLTALGVETRIVPLGAQVRELRKDTLGFGSLKVGAVLATFFYALRIAWLARRTGARIIHSNSLKSDIYGGLAGLLARCPVIWHVRDHINPAYLPNLAVRAFRLLAAWLPTFVIANSESTLGELHLDRQQPAAIVPSGLRLRSEVVHDGLTRELDPAATPLGAAGRAWHRPVRIGLVGRIARWKGQHIFLEAARLVRAAGHEAEFWIVGAPLFGEESYEQELRAQADREQLGSVVRFLGFCPNVTETLRELDLLVHASITPEPFGQVVIEGMAEGLPVIATNGGGVREIIHHEKNGLLVPMDDAAALAESLCALLNDCARARRLGTAGYHWVRRHFTAEQSARKIERIYRTVLAGSAL